MEKYSGWRDAGTGIHPFLWPKAKRRSDDQVVYAAVKYYLLGPLIAPIRLVLLAILLLLVALLDIVGYLLFVPILVNFWHRLVHFLVLRLCLFVLGFHWISHENVTKKPESKEPKVLICNHVSYVDVLYLAWRFAPKFTRVSRTGRVSEISTWQAFMNAISPPNVEDSADGLELQEFLQNSSGKIVIFPEGTTSNGRGLLKFLPVFEGVNFLKVPMSVIGFTYDYEAYCPCYTQTQPFMGHLMGLLMQFNNTLLVKQTDNSLDALTTLSQMLKLKKTAQTAQQKLEFLDFYHKKHYSS